jgi:hypothetical protein
MYAPPTLRSPKGEPFALSWHLMRVRFLLAALGLHVALTLAFATKKPPMMVPAPTSEVDVDFAIEERVPDPEPIREALPGTTKTSIAAATSTMTTAARSTSTTPRPEATPVEPETASSGSWSAPIFVGGAPAPMDTRAPSSFFTLPDRASAPAPTSHGSTTGGLAEGLAEHDASLGLGSGGPVVSATHAIPVEAIVSVDGVGVFDVETDASGRVVAVRLADVSSDDAEWRKVAQALMAQLAKTPLKVPSGARGVAVRLRVEVVARMPSGAKAGHSLAPYSGLDGETAHLGMRGDLSDIGASSVRTVHARVVASRPL